LQQRAIYKVDGVHIERDLLQSVPARLDGRGLSLAPPRPPDHGALAAWHFHPFGSAAGAREHSVHVQPLSLDKFGEPLHRFPAITIAACNLRPSSRGTIRIKSNAPDQAPAIAPNYLSTPDDRQVAADAIRVTRRLMKQHALAAYHPQEYLPGPSVGDDDDR
jgi:choline dehydrogenase-like flavoprotein